MPPRPPSFYETHGLRATSMDLNPSVAPFSLAGYISGQLDTAITLRDASNNHTPSLPPSIPTRSSATANIPATLWSRSLPVDSANASNQPTISGPTAPTQPTISVRQFLVRQLAETQQAERIYTKRVRFAAVQSIRAATATRLSSYNPSETSDANDDDANDANDANDTGSSPAPGAEDGSGSGSGSDPIVDEEDDDDDSILFTPPPGEVTYVYVPGGQRGRRTLSTPFGSALLDYGIPCDGPAPSMFGKERVMNAFEPRVDAEGVGVGSAGGGSGGNGVEGFGPRSEVASMASGQYPICNAFEPSVPHESPWGNGLIHYSAWGPKYLPVHLTGAGAGYTTEGTEWPTMTSWGSTRAIRGQEMQACACFACARKNAGMDSMRVATSHRMTWR